MNLYRTLQEAVNNAIKHSSAQIISIEIHCDADYIKISITDNGIGFNEDLISKGNGLLNMEKRMEEIGGSIVFGASNNSGTAIELQIKR